MSMNKTEHLLVCLIEECAEVQKKATKALRFGLNNKWKSGYSTADKLLYEFYELLGVFQMLKEENIFPTVDVAALIGRKKERVLKYMAYAAEKGVLTMDEEGNQ